MPIRTSRHSRRILDAIGRRSTIPGQWEGTTAALAWHSPHRLGSESYTSFSSTRKTNCRLCRVDSPRVAIANFRSTPHDVLMLGECKWLPFFHHAFDGGAWSLRQLVDVLDLLWRSALGYASWVNNRTTAGRPRPIAMGWGENETCCYSMAQPFAISHAPTMWKAMYLGHPWTQLWQPCVNLPPFGWERNGPWYHSLTKNANTYLRRQLVIYLCNQMLWVMLQTPSGLGT